MMKKLILITGILLSTSLWADMDKMCFIYQSKYSEGFSEENTDYINNKCERNNILVVYNINSITLNSLTSGYCRADRNVNVIKVDSPEGAPEGDRYLMNCVLYDNKRREVILDD
jgi:hypothetical protein